MVSQGVSRVPGHLYELTGTFTIQQPYNHKECLMPGHLYELTSMFTIQQPYNHKECLMPGHLYELTGTFTIQQPYNNLCNAVINIKGSLSHSTPNSWCVVMDGCTCGNFRVCLNQGLVLRDSVLLCLLFQCYFLEDVVGNGWVKDNKLDISPV